MRSECSPDITGLLRRWSEGEQAALAELTPLAYCAQMMRHILVDHARARLRARRGGGVQPVSLDEALLVSEERSRWLVALDDALSALSKLDPRQGRVVELRFFGGLSVGETAEVLKISPESIKRDWRLAKAWLMRELTAAEAS